MGEPSVITPAELCSGLVADHEGALLVGDGALYHREVFDSVSGVEIADEGLAFPSATSLVLLAHAQALREEFVRPDQIQPMYLRRPDAEAKWDPARS